MAKQNCWEYKKCGREPGGDKISELGICPVALSGEDDGANGGECRGRLCWAVSGSFCGGAVQGVFAQKIGNCLNCEFFEKVKEEEGENLQFLTSEQMKREIPE